MKITKKIASLLMAVLMLVGMSTTVIFAADNSHTITINNETSGHTYEAYQIFQGDLSDDGVLSNVSWGSGVVAAPLLAKLKTSNNAFADCETAEDVADVLSGFQNNSEEIDAFAAIVGNYLSNPAGTSTQEANGDAFKYPINVRGDGYYFVKDQNGSDLSGDAFTKYILKVVGDVTVNAKDDVPELDKNILGEDDEKIKITNGSVGDVVNYVIDSKVPNMDGYKSYLFQVSDTMSAGLTFNDDITVKIGDTELDKDNGDFTVTKGEDPTFKLYIKNFIQYKNQAGAPIVITYSATINQAAVVGSDSNDNTAKLEYSNNPNQSDPDPENPDEPNPNNPSGTTPESVTKTYTTGIELLKVDGTTQNALTDAKFQISGTSMKVVIVNKEIFKESETGTYYRLKDGKYTETPPTEDTQDAYESTTVKYEKVTVIDKTNSSEPFEAEGWVNSEGVLTFDGLGEGTYEITELVAPDGYNILSDPINVVVTFNKGTWSASVNGENLTVEDGIVKLTVENKKGAELPSTGGVGTYVFYAVGGVLVAGALIVLIAKKRSKSTK